MSKTVLIGQNLTLKEMYALNLSMYLGTEILEVESVEDANKLLDLIKKVELIVVFNSESKDQPLEDVLGLIKRKNKIIPFVLMGGSDPALKNTYHISDPLDVVRLIKMSAKILRVTAKEMAEKDVGQFYPINASILLEIKAAFCDIYTLPLMARPGGGNRVEEFVKALGKGEVISEKFKNQLRKQPENQYFIPSILRLKFTNHCTQELIEVLEKDGLAHHEKLKLIETTTQVVHEELRNYGITENVIQLSQTCLKSIRKTITHDLKLENLLQMLEGNKASYAFSHCQITTYVAFFLLRNMKWGSAEQEDKISFAIFFHDIFLPNDHLCKIHSSEELDEANLSPEKWELVQNHALKASELIVQYPFAPLGAEILIKQHHGSSRGVGFSDPLEPDIVPMVHVFMIAEDFAQRISSIQQTLDCEVIEATVNLMKAQYKHPKQLVIVELLKTISF